jgi:glucose/mannose-6-phosphate isomerase
MEEQLHHFNTQFSWDPLVEHADNLPHHFSHVIVCGMGGSHLGARLLLRHDPSLDLSLHSDYGLPRQSRNRLQDALLVASSYSGETEETIDAARRAVEAGLALAVITTGGALADFAEEHEIPFIRLPKAEVEPRMAVGVSMLALTRLMRNEGMEKVVREAGSRVAVAEGKALGETLAKRLVGTTPLIYTSTLDMPIAYFWKIVFNETSKVPAFYNLFPEVCHNELSGFDAPESAQPLSRNLHTLFLTDSDNHPRIETRMRIMQKLLEDRRIDATTIELTGETGLEKAFRGILTGVWTAIALAKTYGAPDAATPLIAEFKRTMLTS